MSDAATMQLILIASAMGELRHPFIGLPGLGLLALLVFLFSLIAADTLDPAGRKKCFVVALSLTAFELFWAAIFLSGYERNIGQEDQRFRGWLPHYSFGFIISVLCIAIAWFLKRRPNAAGTDAQTE